MNKAEREAAWIEQWQRMNAYEDALRRQGLTLIAGADEAGRGPLAGPVTAAAVILPADAYIPGLNDSKQLSPARRAALEQQIKAVAVAWACCSVEPEVIDRINILEAARLAMTRAAEALSPQPQHILIDALTLPLDIPQQGIIKGDALSVSIAAASIIAKETRDRLMTEYDKQYPQYQFAKHKGYPTALHKQLLRQYGPCPIHRRSFRY